MSSENLIPHSHAARLERRDEKWRKALAFLRTELWTLPEIIGLVVGVSDPRTIRSTIASMVRDELLVREECVLPSGRRVSLVGITMNGQAYVAHLLNKPLVERAFERGRAGLTQVEHRTDLQRLRIQLAHAGWTGWNYPDRQSVAEKSQAGGHRADAIVTAPDGADCALECERSVKHRARYRFILSQHMTAITRGDYQRVIYTSPSESTRDAARSLITNCDRVIVSGRDTVVTPEMLSHFSFTTYQQLIEGAAK
jgi:hypothetical protein